MKGGRRRYFKPDEWYVDWSAQAVQTYRSNHKARFQNPDYYFRHGIGVPMVSSSSISAAILKDRVFDQSVVGIFPQEEKWLYYLLAFFNTETCNTLIRTINPTANNSANYIKKIPLLLRTTRLSTSSILRRDNYLSRLGQPEQSMRRCGDPLK